MGAIPVVSHPIDALFMSPIVFTVTLLGHSRKADQFTLASKDTVYE